MNKEKFSSEEKKLAIEISEEAALQCSYQCTAAEAVIHRKVVTRGGGSEWLCTRCSRVKNSFF